MPNIIVIVLSVILLGVSIYLLCRARSIKLTKDEEKENYESELQFAINHLEGEKSTEEFRLNLIKMQIEDEQKRFDAERARAEEEYEKRKNELSSQEQAHQQILSNSSSEYFITLEKSYKKVEQEFDDQIANLEKARDALVQDVLSCQKKIEDLKQTLAAGVEAQLKEREREEKKDFYRVNLSIADAQDVVRLEALKPSLNKPDILSKLIWSTYFQKQTTEMCNRILGTKDVVCGIYKITNLITKQMYIGQSVDIATRWKTHMKCGLGIDAPSTNKLYKAMQEDGIVNFTFEVLEQCSRDQLNEKEAFWIETYSADKIGYNSTKGNTSRAAT